MGAVSALLASMTATTEPLAELGLFAAASVPILFSDIREKRIPNIWVAVAAAAVLVVRLAWGRFGWWQLVDGCIGGGAVWLVWYASGERIGLGDAKLSALIAFLLGWRGWLVAFFLASFAGTVVAVASRRGNRGGAIAFAPFLCFGAVAAFWLQRPLWSMFAV